MTPATVARFTKPEETPAKKLLAAGITPDGTVPPKVEKLASPKQSHVSD
jgi:hypothetical protein